MLRSFIRFSLLESKVQDLEKKYVNNRFTKDEFDKLSAMDKTPTKKYLQWMCKQFSTDKYSLARITQAIDVFNTNTFRFAHMDLNHYKTLEELELEVKRVKHFLYEKESQKPIFKKLHEDEELLLVRVDNHSAIMKYGAGTKWCITMNDDSSYNEYSENNFIYVLILKFISDIEPFHKICVIVNKQSGSMKWFNLDDIEYQQIDDMVLDIEPPSWSHPDIENVLLKSQKLIKNDSLTSNNS